MRRLTFITLVGAIAVAVASCTSEDTSVAPSPNPSPEAAAPAKSPTAQTFAKPLVAQKPAGTSTVPGLLQSTNPNERAKQVQASIAADKAKVQKTVSKNKDRDPFEGAPLAIPNPQVSVATTQVPVSPSVPTLPTVRRPIVGTPLPPQIATGRPPKPTSPFPLSSRNRPVASRPSSPLPRPSGTSAPLPGSPAPDGTPVAKIPEPPSTTNADGIVVTGVVQVGNQPQAIVQAPNEPSRYVRVGQRIAQGQVLVKRIEMNGGEPIVVLEENGVEVSRTVGSGGAPTQATT